MQLPKQVQLAAKADTIARLRYKAAQNRYMVGKIDITNLFIAQNEKDQARQGFISALSDFWTGWYELRQMTLYNFQTGKAISYDE
jgi:outer membrane protein TolC